MRASIHKIAVYGSALGFVAFAIVLFQFFHGPIDRPDNSSRVNAEVVIQSLLKGKGDTNKKAASIEANNVNDALSYIGIVFAFLALVAGAISYVRDENKEAAYVSLSVGGAALLFHLLLIAVGLIIIFMILVFFLKN